MIAPLLRFRGTEPGTINGAVIEDVISGQIYPPGSTVFTDNPIFIWQATFTATNFTPRQVALSTTTYRFDVYPENGRLRSESRMTGLTEGRGSIAITPAPGAILAFATAGAWFGPRRRVRARIG